LAKKKSTGKTNAKSNPTLNVERGEWPTDEDIRGNNTKGPDEKLVNCVKQRKDHSKKEKEEKGVKKGGKVGP